MDKEQLVIGLFFNFSNTFDMVNHGILLDKI